MKEEKVPDLQNTNDVKVPDSERRIGPYLLVRKLGEGGMGAVWLAEQQEPVRRMVALKLIRAGMDSESVIRRFSSERQALALMRHPAIARVYDAGSTPDGRPYFVMEHVDGVPITDYCDAHRLTIPQRLELFVTVCEGIQHAHQKAILHRDLKPSNVLVEEQDGKPAVKIIDFGLAKEIGSSLTQTMASEVVGTPRYMSPEQLDFGPDGVDTRTDVYSLGVMLYELLTGTTPHSESRAFDELLSNIRLGDVSPPSSRFAITTEASSAAAAQCGATPEAVRKQLAGDLDWITVKALATDREQRYSSASEFAADILRHLRDEPVQARRPSAAYRMAKFARRNRLSVLLGGLAATLVVGLAVTMTVQAIRIAKERDRANHEAETTRSIAQFLTRMFAVSNPNEARGNSVTAREILDNASQQIESNLKQSPEVRGQLMYTMGDTYLGLGLPKKAKTLLENAIALQSQALGKENPATLRSMTRLGYTLGILGDYADAEKLLRSTLETERRTLGNDNVDVLSTAGFLADVLSVLGRKAETEKLVLETIQAQSRIFGPEGGQTLRSERVLSKTLFDERKYQEAEQQMRDTLAVHRRVFGAEYPGTLYEANLFGMTLNSLGRYAEAEKLQRETLEIQKRVLGPAHPNTMATLGNLALAVQGQGRRSEAIALYRDALASQIKMFGPDHLSTLNVENDLAIALDQDHQFAEAAALFRSVIEKRRRTLPPGHPLVIDGICSLGTTLAYLGQHAEAERMFQDAVREAQRSEGSAPLAEAYFHYGVGAALAGDRPKALELLEKAVGLGLDPVTYGFSKESDLKSMHGDTRFEALAARMHSPSGADRK
jgi:eukaryotic-like serine/threonine-protein kinase